MRIVLLPGMGCTPVANSNWYTWFATEMKKRSYCEEFILRDFPDPYQCKERIWMDFVQETIGLDDTTVIVGHSSGAACAMRLLEQHHERPLLGCVLVAACYTDLGDDGERRSGYFNRPWDWTKMKSGAQEIIFFHGEDDPLIPVKEARYITEHMRGSNFEYHEMEGKGHFFSPWPDILNVMDRKFGGTTKFTSGQY